MFVSREEIMEAVLSNDVEHTVEILERFNFQRDDAPRFTASGKDLTQTVLRFASILDREGDLDRTLADELIHRIAMTVDIFSLLQVVTVGADFVARSPGEMPTKVRQALVMCIYNKEVADTIVDMTSEEFEALATFAMSEEVKALDSRLNASIIQCIYDFDLLPDGMLWAYMGLCQRKVAPAGFGGLNVIGLVALDMADDEEEDADDDDEDADETLCSNGCNGKCKDCDGECGYCNGCNDEHD